MKKNLQAVFQSILATLILWAVLELILWGLGVPPGASRFTEGVIIRQQVPVQKPAGEFRIFVYGESSIHGSHYWPVSSPALWMEVYLHDFLPDKKIRMVNFGRMGQGSYRTYESFRDSVSYKPDLVIFYYGHNAFLPGNRKKEVLAKDRKKGAFWRDMMRHSRLLSAAYRLAIMEAIEHKKEDPSQDSIEYKVIETPPAGLGPENAFPNNSPAYWENIEFFKTNTRKILDLARQNRIPVLFCKPASNLKDFPPDLSTHLKKLSKGEEARFQDFYEKGKRAQGGALFAQAAGFFEQAYQIDNTYADLDFRLGSLYFKQGELEKAKRLFIQARDYDTIKVRAGSDILYFFDELKEKEAVPMVDAEKAVISEAPGGILGEPIIEDNVHFSIKGHALLGRALAQAIAEQGWIAPIRQWHFNKERSYEQIYKDLGVDDELLFSADLKMVHYFGSRFDNRVRFAEKALAIHPQDPKALRHLAWSYWLKGDPGKALELYKKLNEINTAALADVFQNCADIKKAFTEKFPSVKI